MSVYLKLNLETGLKCIEVSSKSQKVSTNDASILTQSFFKKRILLHKTL